MRDFLHRNQQDDENWLPIADIMTSLFVIFLFITIIAIKESGRLEIISETLQSKAKKQAITIAVQNRTLKSTNITNDDLQDVREAVYYLSEIKDAIYKALMEEFKDDLPIWQAEIDRKTLSFRFNEPTILFYPGSHAIRPRFQEIITDFFPRYMYQLRDFQSDIDEVRIEGHTSSEWVGAKTENEAFAKNMELSQQRTLSVLLYTLKLDLPENVAGWARQKVTANGFSSTRLIKRKNGAEDKPASRRVEFRVYANEVETLEKIKTIIVND